MLVVNVVFISDFHYDLIKATSPPWSAPYDKTCLINDGMHETVNGVLHLELVVWLLK